MSEKKLQAELAALRASTSWRITAPLRAVGSMRQQVDLGRLSPGRIIRGVLRRILKNPLLRRLGAAVLTPFPSLRERVRQRVLARAQMLALNGGHLLKGAEADLSSPAREVLAELRRARRKAF